MNDFTRSSQAPAENEQRLRVRLLHLFALVSRPMTLGVRGLVFDADKRQILLIRHTYVAGWHLPGGGVESGETMETALARELEEEGNIALLGKPELKSIHFNRRASRRDHVAFYLITQFRQTGSHVPDLEIAEARFFPLDALPETTTEPTLHRLAEVFDGAPVSPEW